MKSHIQLSIASLVIMGLAGCCSEEGKRRAGAADPAAAAAAVAMPVESAAATQSDAKKGMKLHVVSTPGVTLVAVVEKAGCENGFSRAAEVNVQWKVDKIGVSTVRILVAAQGEQPKIWHEGGAVDAKTTGPWIDGGARLDVVDAATQESLGTITAEATACGH